jgi:hypothetical protein
MILVDWTRMGRAYCLAGAVFHDQQWRIVRPLLTKFREAPVRNIGWSAYLMDGHARWEVFELIGAQPAAPEPPHVEDLWVRALKPRRSSASPEQRRAILAATTAPPNVPVFGFELATTRTAAYLLPGTGQRSLATVVVPSSRLRFEAAWRLGSFEPELPLPHVGNRWLPVKDHHLLLRMERATSDLGQRIRFLDTVVHQMGEQVAVRLGLSRPFQGRTEQPSMCWLMADGFFPLTVAEP